MAIMALVTVYQLLHASYSTFVSIYVAIDTLKTEPAWIQLIFLQLFRKINSRYFQLDFLFAKLDFSFFLFVVWVRGNRFKKRAYATSIIINS